MSSTRRRPWSTAAAPPLEDDDLLSEILVRLSPQPSSLPRASAVCKHWRRLVSDPRFLHRFRLHHRRDPPLLGFFHAYKVIFRPALEAPDRIPAGCFSLVSDFNQRLGCRHGLVLDFYHALSSPNLLVWDPVTGDQHRVLIPPSFDMTLLLGNHGAVLGAAGDVHNCQVVLVGNDIKDNARTIACVYSSETGVWSNFISTLLPSESSFRRGVVFTGRPSVLVGNCLYWLLWKSSILEFDLDRQSLAVVPLPASLHAKRFLDHLSVIRADDGGLGLIFLSDCNAQLWKMKIDCDGVASWVLERTIELDKLLSLNSEEERKSLSISGFAENNNVVILRTSIGLFTIQLESLRFKKLSETRCLGWHHAFESVYLAGTGIGGRHDEAELLIGQKKFAWRDVLD